MAAKIEGGWLGSRKARVRAELNEHYQTNKVIRHARHDLPRRVLRWLVAGRSVFELVGIYALVLSAALACELWAAWQWQCLLPGWGGDALSSLLKDAAGFLLAAQVGILAIVAVAVGIVTLIVQDSDGLGTKSNVRLYYSEGFAYELTRSGVALLLVLVGQLFWPIHHIIHALGLGTKELIFEVALTFLHSVWLALNICLFLFFILSSLNFVDPDARARMRMQYTASVGIPGDLADKLFDLFYRGATAELLENMDRINGPTVDFKRLPFISDNAAVEIARQFNRPVAVTDVWLRPLGLVVRSWVKRTRRNPNNARPPALVFPGDTGAEGEDEVKIVLRDGGAPLRWWDRALIGFSFRYRDAGSGDVKVATPTEFLEGLVSSLVSAIEGGSFSGFKAKLSETIDYHRFALAALNSRDSAGEPSSLAEMRIPDHRGHGFHGMVGMISTEGGRPLMRG